ncbi:ABC transporter permease [Microbacterium sp. G2-8]|uniref:ABC transporter permease n=1 Tax=Microbacterium sp. G2-8 TaxID=2842454 RepID=UPI001C89F5D2|nr:ABC transporter permease [Microbacterium sp. G2-8]
MSAALADTGTMLRRNLVRALRSGYWIYVVAIPIVILLLFVFVLGETLGAGITGGDRTDYLVYVLPGIVLLAIAAGPQLTAITVAQDMTEGIIARFRTMDISRGAVLWGHVVANGLQQFLGLVVVVGLSLLLGYRSDASALSWLSAAGVAAVLILAFSWLAVALGSVSKNIESASNLPMPIMFLPFFGSSFVPTESMPGWLQWFADHQPFTPFTETMRALMEGTSPGASLWATVAWAVVIGIVGYVWARVQYERRSLRA